MDCKIFFLHKWLDVLDWYYDYSMPSNNRLMEIRGGSVSDKIQLGCDVCGAKFQHGHGVYDGHTLHLYGGASCCKKCWDGNWDGWKPALEEKMVSICKDHNVQPPTENDNGLLPRN